MVGALRRALRIVVIVLVLAALAMAGRLVLLARKGGSVVQERMASCPASPNCVSSQEERASHRVEPLSVVGSPSDAFRRAAEAVRTLPRTTIRTEESGYLHAECASALFGFVDDLELELDQAAGVIHVRSASRVGHSDLGVNRRRVERLRAALERGDQD